MCGGESVSSEERDDEDDSLRARVSRCGGVRHTRMIACSFVLWPRVVQKKKKKKPLLQAARKKNDNNKSRGFKNNLAQ